MYHATKSALEKAFVRLFLCGSATQTFHLQLKLFIFGNFQGNTPFLKKIPVGAEASNVLVGEVDFLDKPVSAFIRLTNAFVLGDLTEVPVPTRFIFILLGPVVSIRLHLFVKNCR